MELLSRVSQNVVAEDHVYADRELDECEDRHVLDEAHLEMERLA